VWLGPAVAACILCWTVFAFIFLADDHEELPKSGQRCDNDTDVLFKAGRIDQFHKILKQWTGMKGSVGWKDIPCPGSTRCGVP